MKQSYRITTLRLAALFVFIAYDFTRQTQDKKLFPRPNVEQEAVRKEQMDQCKEQENDTKLQNYNSKLAALFVIIAYDSNSQTQDKELFPQPNVEQGAARKEQMDQCKEQKNETKLQNYNS
ncbi:hypothetical protein RRG08_004713 [Elysia crispata]|uniref:Uncharacterized protein n=1 Tax=Elysia crispata TaxID=231223 RepID=A0AAE1CMJ7_9GAST|nr:hypothetical protein RRG08_004713 [Elysia crispata]